MNSAASLVVLRYILMSSKESKASQRNALDDGKTIKNSIDFINLGVMAMNN